MVRSLLFSRPLHGLGNQLWVMIPALKCWAIVSRPLRGLSEILHYLRITPELFARNLRYAVRRLFDASFAGTHTRLQDLVLGEVFQLLKILSILIESVLRYETNDFCVRDLYTQFVSFTTYSLEGLTHPCLAVVHEVHGYLDQPSGTQLKTQGLQKWKSSMSRSN